MKHMKLNIVMALVASVLMLSGCNPKADEGSCDKVSSGMQVKCVVECVNKAMSNADQAAINKAAKDLRSAMCAHKAANPETCKKSDYIEMQSAALSAIDNLIALKSIEQASTCVGAIMPTCSACHVKYKK